MRYLFFIFFTVFLTPSTYSQITITENKSAFLFDTKMHDGELVSTSAKKATLCVLKRTTRHKAMPILKSDSAGVVYNSVEYKGLKKTYKFQNCTLDIYTFKYMDRYYYHIHTKWNSKIFYFTFYTIDFIDIRPEKIVLKEQGIELYFYKENSDILYFSVWHKIDNSSMIYTSYD
jgi:hypothetical protein